MAAGASSPKTCGHCKATNLVQSKNGWTLKSGEFALLCEPCGSVYEEGRFCETFHSNENGWRKCVACGKVHCGCVVSINTIILLETFGVACLNCAMNTSTMAPNQCDSPSWSTTLAESLHNTSSPCEVEESNNNDKVNGSKCEANAVAKSGQSPFHDTPSQMKAPLPNGQPCGSGAGQKGLDAKYQPRISDHVLQQISRDLNSVVTPLFEKTLTISDADYKLGRLVIPKKCAQEYFPLISGPEGVTIRILDTRGREWVFHYRYWSNANSQMYVLDGLKDFIISMQWQAGDVVTFYWIEPKGQLVLGLRKASVTPPSHKDEQREASLAPKRLNQVQFLISNICPDELPTPPSLQVSLLLRLVVLSALWHRGFILLGINMRWSKERMK